MVLRSYLRIGCLVLRSYLRSGYMAVRSSEEWSHGVAFKLKGQLHEAAFIPEDW